MVKKLGMQVKCKTCKWYWVLCLQVILGLWALSVLCCFLWPFVALSKYVASTSLLSIPCWTWNLSSSMLKAELWFEFGQPQSTPPSFWSDLGRRLLWMQAWLRFLVLSFVSRSFLLFFKAFSSWFILALFSQFCARLVDFSC